MTEGSSFLSLFSELWHPVNGSHGLRSFIELENAAHYEGLD